jgi:hypothetical protein
MNGRLGERENEWESGRLGDWVTKKMTDKAGLTGK